MRACVRACVHACVRACVRAVYFSHLKMIRGYINHPLKTNECYVKVAPHGGLWRFNVSPSSDKENEEGRGSSSILAFCLTV